MLDFARQGKDFAECNVDRFYTERAAELVEASDGLKDTSEQEVVEKIWQLCRRHGEQLLEAIRRMREAHDNPYKPLPRGSFLHMVSEREYLKAPTGRFVDTVCRKLSVSIRDHRPETPPIVRDLIRSKTRSQSTHTSRSE
jgi:hypothetical protein